MTYQDLRRTAETFIKIDKEIYKSLMSIINKSLALGVSADECMLMISCVLNPPTDEEVYKRDKETKHRVIDGGFYIACKEYSQLKN